MCACWQLNIKWGNVKLVHSDNPVYLGVTLDRTLSFKTHTERRKPKYTLGTTILKSSEFHSGGAHPTTVRTAALALCYCAVPQSMPAQFGQDPAMPRK